MTNYWALFNWVDLKIASWSSWVDGKFCDGQCGGNPGVRARYRKCNNPAPRGSQEHCQLVDGTKGLEEKELNIPCMNNDPCDGKEKYFLEIAKYRSFLNANNFSKSSRWLDRLEWMAVQYVWLRWSRSRDKGPYLYWGCSKLSRPREGEEGSMPNCSPTIGRRNETMYVYVVCCWIWSHNPKTNHLSHATFLLQVKTVFQIVSFQYLCYPYANKDT